MPQIQLLKKYFSMRIERGFSWQIEFLQETAYIIQQWLIEHCHNFDRSKFLFYHLILKNWQKRMICCLLPSCLPRYPAVIMIWMKSDVLLQRLWARLALKSNSLVDWNLQLTSDVRFINPLHAVDNAIEYRPIVLWCL